jgi:hypothetical protein
MNGRLSAMPRWLNSIRNEDRPALGNWPGLFLYLFFFTYFSLAIFLGSFFLAHFLSWPIFLALPKTMAALLIHCAFIKQFPDSAEPGAVAFVVGAGMQNA